eukprot:CAMPEP_0182836380 /NCGR_PEP_ID=MMETSP0006_2-20121128/22064_1 /TAXON_ID=97485 /ORGANISM="Prymnesium parvum, Strain Texoma1" /LENGTH=110 /DNA_ID=CAMNT_0024964983 /DNA_START=465 /DNA_END=793 /DNA_ORIENTATION=+
MARWLCNRDGRVLGHACLRKVRVGPPSPDRVAAHYLLARQPPTDERRARRCSGEGKFHRRLPSLWRGDAREPNHWRLHAVGLLVLLSELVVERLGVEVDRGHWEEGVPRA